MQYIAACRQSGIEVLPPDVNSSGIEFTAMAEGIRFGLAGIRGVGEGAAEQIIAEREKSGPYTSLHDFAFRISNTMCNKKTVEALVKAGAFDSTGYTRKQMMRFLEVDNLMDVAAKRHRDKADGQVSMFDMFAENNIDSGFEEDIPAPDGVEWERRVKLRFEHDILKMYVSDHPLSPYADLLRHNSQYSLGVFMGGGDDEDGAVEEDQAAEDRVPQGKPIKLAGMVTALTPMTSKKGDMMAKFTLEDMDGSIDAIIFPTYYKECGKALEADAEGHDAVVKVVCKYESTDRGQQILVSKVEKLSLDEQVVRPQPMEVHVTSEVFNQQTADMLNRTLARYPGIDPVVLYIGSADGKKFRAELPTTVDGRSPDLRRELDLVLSV
ncbi:MAG TPA: hypothetical protein DEB24_06255 [Coriobacteriia bacterium]|nr:hypothetical protein [Coriobacteriia bacterium]